MNSDTYYLCNKITKEVLSIGPLPATYENIPGILGCSYDVISDLTWAGHPGVGFLTQDDALKYGVDPSIIKASQLKDLDSKWEYVKNQRDSMIQNVRWRIDRHNDEVALGRVPTDNIMPILEYIQKLRDITTQQDPYNIEWPVLTV